VVVLAVTTAVSATTSLPEVLVRPLQLQLLRRRQQWRTPCPL
jgi:hypothetical protein